MDINEKLRLIDLNLSRGDIAGAGILLDSLTQFLSDMNDLQKSFFFYLKAIYWELTGDYDKMCQAANYSFNLAQKDEQRINALNIWAMANIRKFEKYKSQEFLTDAEGLLDKALVIGDNCESKFSMLESLIFKSDLFRVRGEFNEAIKTLNAAAHIAEEYKIYNELSLIICKIGDVYSLMGFKNIALSEFRRVEKFANQGGNYEFYCRIVIHRLAVMFELAESNPNLAQIAQTDIINIAHQKI